MSSSSFLNVLADVFSGPLVSVVYPLCASIQALERNSQAEYRKLLTYWVMYSIITLLEVSLGKAIDWMPFWYLVRLVVNCFLVFPYFGGSLYAYQQYVRQVITDPHVFLENQSWLLDIFVDLLEVAKDGLKYVGANIYVPDQLLLRRRRRSKGEAHSGSAVVDHDD